MPPDGVIFFPFQRYISRRKKTFSANFFSQRGHFESSALGKAFLFFDRYLLCSNIKKLTWMSVLLFKILNLLKQAMKHTKARFLCS